MKELVHNKSLVIRLFLMIFFYYLFLFISKAEFIRGDYSDFSFNVINNIFYKYPSFQTNTSKIFIIMFDDDYLKKNKLMNKYNESEYGYVFPREIIAKFIDELDNFVKKHKKNPKALFIDYDFSYGSLSNGKLSSGDKKLLEVLAKDRNYTIFLPITNTHNFILNSKNPKIQSLIKNNKIVFVTAGLGQSGDGNIKRYVIKSKIGNKYYYNLIFYLYQMDTDTTIENITTKYKNSSIYERNIFFKGYKDEGHYCPSYWNNIYKTTVNWWKGNLELRKEFQNSYIFLGSSYTFNKDNYSIFPWFWSPEMNGVEILANAYETLSFFDGPINVYSFKNVVFSMIVLFLVFLLWNIMRRDEDNECDIISFIIRVFFISILVLITFLLLWKFKIWIDFALIILAFACVECLYCLIKTYFFRLVAYLWKFLDNFKKQSYNK